MRKIFAPILILILLTTLVGCEKTPIPDTTSATDSWPSAKPIINTITVTEKKLSEIKTEETDWFANNFNTCQPYIDNNGKMYYYTSEKDSSSSVLCYDNRNHTPVSLGIPDGDVFTVGVILDGVVYGVEHTDGMLGNNFIVSYKNGTRTQLIDLEVHGCYFAEEGIYYQNYNTIYLMDYSGKHSLSIVDIPDELFYLSVHSNFIVYRGLLWYSYNDFFHQYPYPLWCYDFNGTFTKFNHGGLDAVNNGFLYYQFPNSTSSPLYRFNCETYCVELVSDAKYINGFSFANDYVLCTSWEQESDTLNLYRINSHENSKILTPNQLKQSNEVLKVSSYVNRIFVVGGTDISYQCLAEIDIDGNVIEIIHEDNLY